MDKSDFEILLFKARNIEVKPVVDMLGQFTLDNGYLACIVDNNKKWDVGTLENIKLSIETAEITDKMVKNAQKKVIILQARGFLDDDLVLVKEKISDALIEYDINVLLLDKNVTLERADTFFNRVAKHIKVFERIKADKKRKFRENQHGTK